MQSVKDLSCSITDWQLRLHQGVCAYWVFARESEQLRPHPGLLAGQCSYNWSKWNEWQFFPQRPKRNLNWRETRKEAVSFEIYLQASKWKRLNFLSFFASSLFLIHATLKPHSHGIKAHSINGNIFAPLQTSSNCGARSRCRCSVETQVKNRHDGVSWCSYFLFLITVNNWS